jgi:hypothetical protein
MKKYILILLSLVALSNCRKNDEAPIYKYIYKTKGDYFNFVSCYLKKDNIHFAAIYDPGGKINRTRLAQNYVLDQIGFNLNDCNEAFLNLTQDEYNAKYNYDTVLKYKDKPDSIEKYVVYKDPFIELYQLKDNTTIDTAHLNDIIRKGELEKYFTKLK